MWGNLGQTSQESRSVATPPLHHQQRARCDLRFLSALPLLTTRSASGTLEAPAQSSLDRAAPQASGARSAWWRLGGCGCRFHLRAASRCAGWRKRKERRAPGDLGTSEILSVEWGSPRECGHGPCGWSLAQDARSFVCADLQQSGGGEYL